MKLGRYVWIFLTLLLSVAPAIGAPAVHFANPVVYNSGGTSAATAMALDLNGDGFPDLVVLNRDGVAVMLNNGDGTFALPVTYGTGGTSAFSMAIGDLNGDGAPDLVVTNMCQSYPNCTNGGIGVLLGNGDGTFQAAVSYDAGGIETEGVVIGDVNNDGFPDVVVTSNCQIVTCATGAIFELLGNGDGTFQTYKVVTSDDGGPIAIGDLDGDGNLDLVADIGVLLGNGDGTFRSLGSVTTPGAVGYIPGGALSIALGDLNNDGLLDVVSVNSSGVKVQLGNGDGTLHNPVNFRSGGAWPTSVTMADVNGDGALDLVVANECSALVNNACSTMGSVGVLAGNGDGTFGAAVSYTSAGKLATSITAADVDQDGKPDLLVTNACLSSANCANGTVGLLRNILKAATSIKVTSSMNPSLVNQPVTLFATLTSSVPVPDGSTVNFFNGTTLIGTGTTILGVANVNFTFKASGPKSIKAAFPGDLYHSAGSGTLTQTVNLYPSTTAVLSNLNPSTFHTSVMLTATVSSGAPGGPTGTVTFKNGTTVLATKTLSGGSATLNTSALPVGTLTIKAIYNGDSQSATSSGTTSQTVN